MEGEASRIRGVEMRTYITNLIPASPALCQNICGKVCNLSNAPSFRPGHLIRVRPDEYSSIAIARPTHIDLTVYLTISPLV